MPYGTIKIDTITFTDAGVDKSIAVSGLVQNPTFTGNVTVTGTVSGTTVRATTVSGVTVSGTTANFASGVYTTQISGEIVKVPAGAPSAPPLQIGTGASVAPGLYSPAIDQLGISTGGSFRLVVDSIGRVGIGTASPANALDVVGSSNVTTSSLAQYFGINATGTAASIANGLFAPTGNTLGFVTNATERARIDSSGRLLVGTSANIANGLVQFGQNTGTAATTVQTISSNSAAGCWLIRSNANAIVASGDVIGSFDFRGYDGTAYQSLGSILAAVDGTPGLNDMPGRLVFSTTADGAAGPTERMRIDSAGNVGIGGTPGSYRLDVQGGGQRILNQGGNSFLEIGHGTVTNQTAYIDIVTDTTYTDFGLRLIRDNTGANAVSQLAQKGTGELSLRCIEAAPLTFYTTNTERLRIDSSGRLLVGTSSNRASRLSTTPFNPLFQLESDVEAAQAITRWSADISGSRLHLQKGRGTIAAPTSVASGDFLADITFSGFDGTNMTNGARIEASVDGTPGLNDMPGRLVFSTTSDGAASPTERLRITNDGVQAYNQPAPAAVNATATLTAANLKAGIITSTSAAATDMTLPTGTDTQAGFSGTYDNMTFEWSVINTGPSLVRVLAGTAHTVVGSGSVATGTSGRFASRRTAANTFVTYRLA